MAPSDRPSRRTTAVGRRARADRDGDVKMGHEAKSQGRVGKAAAVPKGPAATRGKDAAVQSRRGRITSSTTERNIIRAAARGDAPARDGTRPTKPSSLVEFRITGWDRSAASNSADLGAASLQQWLESKVSRKLGSTKRIVKFKKSRVEDNTLLYVSVPEADARVLERMNGFSWAKATLHIERVGGAVKLSSQAEETKAMLQSVLESRYDENAKFLDLSNLGQDGLLKAQAVFDQKSTASKFFPALMKVLEQAFEKPDQRDAAIKSVSLAHNELTDLKAVSTLSVTLPKLENLDLSNNQFAKLQALENWRRRFVQLRHLILSGNPIEQNEPDFAAEMLKWYPNLRMLDQVQVRTEEDIANKNSITNIPFPIRSPVFRDEGGIVENFVKTFFAGFDTDRLQLAAFYYDNLSQFSMSVNTQAPRDPHSTVETAKGDWEQYIKHSRNIKRLNQIGARSSRLAHGPQAVAEVLTSIPKTKHPDLLTEPRKWMIEAQMQPGIPDPTGQSPSGVDGFSVSIHGEYDELDPQTGAPSKKRSVDHFFQLGPALPGSSAVVRIVSHTMTVRSYGGTQAFDPEQFADNHQPAGPLTPPTTQELPAALGMPAGLTVEQATQLIAELQQVTGMTQEYAKMCYDQVGWDARMALDVFQSAKSSLPAEAFMPGAVPGI